jgi:hypothetical protein
MIAPKNLNIGDIVKSGFNAEVFKDKSINQKLITNLSLLNKDCIEN